MHTKHQSIETIEAIHPLTKESDSALVVFDIDYVLLQPRNPSFQFQQFIKHRNYLKTLISELSPLERDLLSTYMVMTTGGSELIESTSAEFIHKISQSNKVMALTASLSGKIEDYLNYEKRHQILNSFNISFSSAFKENSKVVFDEFESNHGSHPLFYEGILFSNGENKKEMKGQVLKAFLKHKNHTPNRLIFVDDREINLNDIQNTFSDEAEVYTFLYQGAHAYPKTSVDEKQVESDWKNLVDRVKSLQLP